MESWNLTPGGPREYFLHNKSDTRFHCSKRAKPNFGSLLHRIEEAGVPIAYTRGVKDVYFTIFAHLHAGDYRDGQIRIDCGVNSHVMLPEILIHELAHHLDDEELISERPEIRKEKKEAAKYLEDKYARTNVSEYVAVGFEVFYFGSPPEKEQFRKHNPALHSAIAEIHEKYAKM